jgi:GT2 family glycosyltransferase
MESKKKVTVILLNYNGKQDTLECLESIQKLQQKKTKINTIVVDNASKDDSVNVIRAKFPKVTIIENKNNLGFCEGNNVGVKLAFDEGADFALILNNDTIVHPNLVEGLVQTAKNQKVGIVSPKIYFAPGFEFHKDRYSKGERGKVIWYAGGLIDWNNILPQHKGVDQVDKGQFEKSEETSFATGCATLVSREAFKNLGLYDSVYFAYFEDADFSLRAQNHGYRVFYSPKAILWHKNASTFGGSGSPFQDYFITRNRLIFGLRHAPPRAKFALLRESFKFIIKGPERKRRAVIDALIHRIPKISSIR